MDSDMIIPKRKIIQKRIKKKERYARMARIRYRKEKNVPLAFVQPLTDIYESVDPRPSYRFYMVSYAYFCIAFGFYRVFLLTGSYIP